MISPLQGIRDFVGAECEVSYLPGYESPAEAPQDRPDAKIVEQGPIDLPALRAEAVAAAAKADAVIFIGGLNKNRFQDCEGVDRTDYNLPYEQNELIAALAKANPYTVVVLLTGNAVATPWRDKVPAIVEGWYNGSEAGNALADVLFGKVNPSGKLPFSFGDNLEDYAAHASGDKHIYPGVDGVVTYSEGLDVGYRYKDMDAVFPFGFGLSYTGFRLGKPSVDKKSFGPGESVTVTVPVTNTGKRAGAEVVQVYVSDTQSSLPRPEKELKGFSKVFLQPGETADAVITLTPEAFMYYDPSRASSDNRETGWTAEPGEFRLLIGNSSANLPQTVTVNLN